MGAHSVKQRQKKFIIKNKELDIEVLTGDEGEIKKTDYIVLAALIGAFAVLSILKLNRIASMACFGILYIAAVLGMAKKSIVGIIHMELLTNETVLFLASLITFICGGYKSAVLLTLCFRCCELLYKYLNYQYEDALGALVDSIPARVRVETENGIKEIAPRGVNIGDVIIVESGDVIPLDGIVISGITSVSLNKVGGNSTEIPIAQNAAICAGCVNQGRQIKIKVTKTYTESFAANLTDQISHAYTSPAKYERYAQYVERYFPIAAIAIAVITFVVSGLKTGEWMQSVQTAATVLALATGGAIGMSVPFAFSCCVANLSRYGVIVKKNSYIADLADTKTAVFCKNGVITDGRYTVYDVVAESGVDASKLLNIAVTAYSNSASPIAAALRMVGTAANLGDMSIEVIDEINNKGIHTKIGVNDVIVGTAEYVNALGVEQKVYDKPGMLVLCVALNKRFVGQITLADKTRSGVFEMIDTLHLNGVTSVVMLTEDDARIAKQSAASLNFDLVKYEINSKEKLKALAYLMENKNKNTALAFIGNFRRDYELMQNSDVGISIKCFGSEAGLEMADVAILGDGVLRVGDLINAAKACKMICRVNAGVALIAKLLLISLAAFNVVGLGTAVIADALLFCFCAWNASRELGEFVKK